MGEIELEEWLRFARDDLEAASLLFDSRPRKREIICFHCQQSAEKYLKSLLARDDILIPRTHSLPSLVTALRFSDEIVQSLAPHLARLQPYAVEVRYPFQFDIDDVTVEKAVVAAKSVAKIVEELISRHPRDREE